MPQNSLTNASPRCPYYHYSAITYKDPNLPKAALHKPSVRIIEWCEHPNSPYPREGNFQILPCGGNLEKCIIPSEKRD